MQDLRAIQELFDELIEVPANQRRSRLAALRATSPTLAEEVEALLSEEEAAPPDSLSTRIRTEDTADAKQGKMIDQYKLLERIGEGGFGSVWLAEQRNPIKRRVALKVIKLGMDTRQVIARFEAERQALALMEHPNIARVFDGGATASGRPYFVMELVRGLPITEFCDTNRLVVRQRLELFIQVCSAVQHAHQKGVIHRDIKPSNVLVTSHDGTPVPKVIDFGIAKATSAELTEKTLFTAHRQMIGTPAYMSPEQAEMNGLDVDTRSDIYSLGVLLYELLTGTTPFDPKKLLESGFAEMLRVIREVDPERPSLRASSLAAAPCQLVVPSSPVDPRQAIAGGSSAGSRFVFDRTRQINLRSLSRFLRGDLDWIVMKCLEKDRTRRYETANSLALDLQRHLRNEPVSAGPPGAAYRLRKFVSRRRGIVVSALIMVNLLFTAVILTTWQAWRATRAEHISSQRAISERQAKEAMIVSREEERRQRGVAERKTADLQRLSGNMALAIAEQAIFRGDFLAASRGLSAVPPDDRDWEWNYLQFSTDRSETTVKLDAPELADDAKLVWDLSSDGHIAVVGANKALALLIFDATTGALLNRFRIPRIANRVYVSPMGTRVLLGHPRGATLLNTTTGEVVWKDPDVVAFDMIAADGRIITCDQNAARVVIRDSHSGREMENIQLPCSGKVEQLVAGRDGAFFSVRCSDRDQSEIFDMRARVGVGRVPGWISLVSGDGQWALCANDRMDLSVLRSYASMDGSSLGVRDLGSDEHRGLAMSPDCRLLAVREPGDAIRLYALPSMARVATLGMISPLAGVRFSQDGSKVFALSPGGELKAWNILCGDQPYRSALGPGYSAAISPCGRWVASGGWGTLRLLDAATGIPRWTRHPHTWFHFAVAISSDSRWVACQARGRRIALLDVETGETVRFLSLPSTAPVFVDSLAFSPDGVHLAAGTSDSAVLLYDLNVAQDDVNPTTIPVTSPDSNEPACVRGLTFSQNGQLLGVVRTRSVTSDTSLLDGETPGVLSLWSLEQPPVLLWSSPNAGRCAQFSPDGRWLATASRSAPLTLHATDSGIEQWRLSAPHESVGALTFSPDGSRLAAAFLNGDVKFWRMDAFAQQTVSDSSASNESVFVLHGSTRTIWTALQFAPDMSSLMGCAYQFGLIRYESTRPSAETYADRGRLSRAAGLLSGHGWGNRLSEEIIQDLEQDTSLEALPRQQAVEIARTNGDDARSLLNTGAIMVIDHYSGLSSPDWPRTLSNLAPCERAYPDVPEVWIVKGHVLFLMDQYEEALKAFQEAIKLIGERGDKDDDPAMWAVTAMAQFRLGRTEEARAALDRARDAAGKPNSGDDRISAPALRQAELLLGLP